MTNNNVKVCEVSDRNIYILSWSDIYSSVFRLEKIAVVFKSCCLINDIRNIFWENVVLSRAVSGWREPWSVFCVGYVQFSSGH